MGIYEELLKRDAKLIAGGAAQNTARGAQYMLPPNSVIFIGCVGKDKYADVLLEANKKAGLAVKYRFDEKVGTGRCGVVITGHNRSMCTDLAAANCYKIEHLKENWDVVEKSKAYYVGGYHLTVCVEAVMALAEEANKENKVCSQIGMGRGRCGTKSSSPSSFHFRHRSSHNSSRILSTRRHHTGITWSVMRPKPCLMLTRTT